MEAAASPASITTSPAPAVEGPLPAALVASTPDVAVRVSNSPESTWPRSAQTAAALLLLLSLSLLGWHIWSAQRGRCRPAILEADSLNKPSINLNDADHAQLLQLPGVGESLAQRIETYRAKQHGFRAVEELRRVPGVGPALMEKLRPFVYVDPDVSDEESDPAGTSPIQTSKPRLDSKTKAKLLTKRIDINRAAAADLRRLPGIGPVLADRILAVRAKQPFRTVDDLRRVKGIGPQKLMMLRPHVVVRAADEEEIAAGPNPP